MHKLNRFSRQSRVLATHDFQEIRQQGDRIRHYPFYAYTKKDNIQKARIGIVISKKQIRFAVNRNRVRRHVKEWFRLNQCVLPCCDIVLIVTAGANDLNGDELRRCLDKLQQKLITRCNAA